MGRSRSTKASCAGSFSPAPRGGSVGKRPSRRSVQSRNFSRSSLSESELREKFLDCTDRRLGLFPTEPPRGAGEKLPAQLAFVDRLLPMAFRAPVRLVPYLPSVPAPAAGPCVL